MVDGPVVHRPPQVPPPRQGNNNDRRDIVDEINALQVGPQQGQVDTFTQIQNEPVTPQGVQPLSGDELLAQIQGAPAGQGGSSQDLVTEIMNEPTAAQAPGGPAPAPAPGVQPQRPGQDGLLDEIMNLDIRQFSGAPPAPGTPSTQPATQAPTLEQVEQTATQTRQAFNIQSTTDAATGRTTFNHATYGRALQQIDGSYYFPAPTVNGQGVQPFTVRLVNGRPVVENNSTQLPGTVTISHFNLRNTGRRDYTFVDEQGSVHYLQLDGTVFDSGKKDDGTVVRPARVLNGDQVVAGRTAPLPWTLALAWLCAYPVPNADGSFSVPGDRRRLFIQSDGTIYREPMLNPDGVLIPGSTLKYETDPATGNGQLYRYATRTQPLPSTYALAALIGNSQYKATPTHDGNGKVFKLKGVPGTAVVLNSGRIYYTGGTQDGQNYSPRIFSLTQAGYQWTNDISNLTPAERQEITQATGTAPPTVAPPAPAGAGIPVPPAPVQPAQPLPAGPSGPTSAAPTAPGLEPSVLAAISSNL